jgi:hypothetical protein
MKHMLALIGAIAVAALPYTAAASPGALEINQDCAVAGCFSGDAPGYPITITQPGSYVLTSDLAPPGAGINAIEISASPVDVDLNGHTIDGGGACSGSPVTACSGFAGERGVDVEVSGGAPAVVHIHNGTIRGYGGIGLAIFYANDGTVLDHLTVTENGTGTTIQSNAATATATARILDSQFTRNQNAGLYVSGDVPSEVDVERSTFGGNGGSGAGGGSGSVFLGNHISNNGGTGLYCNPGTCALGQNTFVGNSTITPLAQYVVGTVSDMGGNVCLDNAGSACP